MCGIAGALVSRGSSFALDETFLVRMRETMAHRGPDGAGVWLAPDRRVGLAHRRLAIIDLSERAAQPMASADGSLELVFNGEIYNHAEIRAELLKLGRRRWRTDHSDTEVILEAYAEWGTACLERFRGMFALALWDARLRKLWLVRDRVGVKPLYYARHHGRLVFASEIKALLTDPELPRAVDLEAFHDYLSFLTSPAPRTLFAGIKKLPCGTWLMVSDDGSIEERRWWDVLDRVEPLVGVGDDEIARRLLAELRVAVKLRKVSDVPVGVFLSGGIDSSTNTALFSEGETGKVDTFSIGYDAAYPSTPSELPHARAVAARFGARHHERILSTGDLIDFLPEMVRLQDEPIADPVCVPVYYVSKLARDAGVVVCQVGEGADELFWGYRGWKVMRALERANAWPVPRLVKRAGLLALGAAGLDDRRAYEFLRRGALGQPVFWGGAEAFFQTEKEKLLAPALRARFRGRTSWESLAPIRRRFEEKAWERTPLQWMTYLDLNLRLPELLLMRVDKMSMGVGLEARVPFLDHKVVELAMSMPEAVKTRGGELKHILKRAACGLIPEQVLKRRKQGFGVPVKEWSGGRLGERMRAELTAFARETEFFDRAEIARQLERGQGARLWYLFNFALWWRQFVA